MRHINRTAAAALAGLVTLSTRAFALTVSGSVDPASGMQSFVAYALPVAGISIVGICCYKGAHAVAEGRSLGPAIGGAIGGTALSFGGAYLLTHYGVS